MTKTARTILTTAVMTTMIGVAGCASAGAEREPGPTTSATTEPMVFCPNPHGGACLGELEPGEYTTSQFEPQLAFTAPEGWVNGEDLPGNLLFYRSVDPQDGPLGGSYVGIYRDVRAAAQNCEEAGEPGIGSTPAELAAWLRSHPGIASSEPQPVSVGELDGLAIDLTIASPWTGACPWSDELPVVALIIGNGVSSLHHVLLGGMSIRLYLLDYEGGNVTIEVTSIDEQLSADDYRAAIEPLLTSFEFVG